MVESVFSCWTNLTMKVAFNIFRSLATLSIHHFLFMLVPIVKQPWTLDLLGFNFVDGIVHLGTRFNIVVFRDNDVLGEVLS